MADVRALLRQQRAARRINHPYALYSDAGKLLCTLCRDHIRAESHWDAHLQSDKHKKRLSAINQSIIDDANAEVEDEDPEDDENNEAGGEEEDAEGHDALAAQKRKLDQLGPEEKDTDMDDEDEARRKRSRPATASEDDPNRNKKPLMPTQGVQVQIASRSSTPSQQPAVPKLATSLPSRQASNLATPASSSSMSISIQPQSSTASLSLSQSQPAQPASQDQQQVDEDEWAAFEADIAAQDYDDDAVISRPAMTAEEAAAAAKDAAEEDAVQNPESRKSKADAEIEDEREEATRALEDEFEEMQELEARVQRLKEKREALMRKRSETLTQDQADDIQTAVKAVSDPQDEGKENVHTTGDSAKTDADDEEEDDEDEEDDWDGFRFRTGR
ncbi:hypothetical protein N5P37_000286 [Trichoderma harzianum]|uniref:Uncharacterized protein n=1 Tax=Trichoderma harzianum CBS 226.95 TaxID=983964 RepID=A0A2T4A1K4_TRIHA|nr:hypothetical protein M431DRAFT_8980 [Trichoderma harzianum CBS 226.95]KAK0766561.1 hypothetical protein N5P37_000286 [Trichoderma harzianum]PKK50660.1 hypothetical protein CI102_7151 [Trichoderma harzianum]PTB50945.1 hypothetical protein M431DRAFT_8980 [Trichoderma harzianum CBS 226.95]